MKLGLLTKDIESWHSIRFFKAMKKCNIEPIYINFSNLITQIAFKPQIIINDDLNLTKEIKGIIVRPIGKGSLDEIIFRLDLLRRLENSGLIIVNSPSSIEKAVDKYFALEILEDNNIRVPKTIVCENPVLAMKGFYNLGQDIVIKPVFGSRGVGITRINDSEIAFRIFRSLTFFHKVLYLQEFIQHGTKDIRAFVIGDEVIAAMYRISHNWKTNISQGAKAVFLKLDKELEDIAIKSAKAIGCEVAGVDILAAKDGYYVNEVNSQPGFKGLQSVVKIDIATQIVKYVLSKTF